MALQIVPLISKWLFGNREQSDEAAQKAQEVRAMFAGGSGDAWLPLARQQETLHCRRIFTCISEVVRPGEGTAESKQIAFQEFAWSEEFETGGDLWRSVRWRFYENGLICLAAQLGKKAQGLDTGDLLGHTIEIREGPVLCWVYGRRHFSSVAAPRAWPFRRR